MEGGCSEKPPHASPHDVGLSSLGMSPPRLCLSRSTFRSFPLLIPLGNQLFSSLLLWPGLGGSEGGLGSRRHEDGDGATPGVLELGCATPVWQDSHPVLLRKTTKKSKTEMKRG